MSHIASAAGVWQALVYGFGGLRDFDGELSFDPRLPSTWRWLRLPLRFRDRQLEVTLTHEEETYRLLAGVPLELTVRGRAYRLTQDEPLVVRPENGEPVPPQRAEREPTATG